MLFVNELTFFLPRALTSSEHHVGKAIERHPFRINKTAISLCHYSSHSVFHSVYVFASQETHWRRRFTLSQFGDDS